MLQWLIKEPPWDRDVSLDQVNEVPNQVGGSANRGFSLIKGVLFCLNDVPEFRVMERFTMTSNIIYDVYSQPDIMNAEILSIMYF